MNYDRQMPHSTRSLVCLFTAALTLCAAGDLADAWAQDVPRNVVIIMSDDHRHDFMGFHSDAPDFLQTPNMDRMAEEGAHLINAFVTTSLCSPSRASILTGQYAHTHGVVDNSTPVPEGTRFFPEDLQEQGYNTAYVGKWHMGEASDDPKPGFDRWVSFRGQGTYYDPLLNIDGEQQQFDGYTTDILTEYALDWLGEQSADGDPFFMILSHKAVHAEFMPAERHEGAYADADIPYPASMPYTESNYQMKPHWVREQRASWHGVDYMYHGDMVFDEFYQRYTETLLALDESVGRVIDHLDQSGLAENTFVLYLGDNGFLLGEHGLIDKRNAYEESMRIPMLAYAPGFVEPGSTIESLVRNIDIAPTVLELAGATTSIDVEGTSFMTLLSDEGGAATTGAADDREFLYEYYWEHAFPHTPTTIALRGDRFKYIYYHGVWDLNELYDLQNDPTESYNLIQSPEFSDVRDEMRNRLFDRLEEADAMRVPIRRGGWQAGERLLQVPGR